MTDTERPEIIPLVEKLADELDAAQRDSIEDYGLEVDGDELRVVDESKLVQPTDEEKRNGWDAVTLSAYLAERAAGQALDIDMNSIQRRMARRPTEQNHRYRVLRWRE